MKYPRCGRCQTDEHSQYKAAWPDCQDLLLRLIDLLDKAIIECNLPPAYSLKNRSSSSPELPWSEAQLLIERERLMHKIDALIYHR